MSEAAFNDNRRDEPLEVQPRILALSWKDEDAVIRATDMTPLSERTREAIEFLLHRINRGGTFVDNAGMPFSVKAGDVSTELLAKLSYNLTCHANEVLNVIAEPEQKHGQSDR